MPFVSTRGLGRQENFGPFHALLRQNLGAGSRKRFAPHPLLAPLLSARPAPCPQVRRQRARIAKECCNERPLGWSVAHSFGCFFWPSPLGGRLCVSLAQRFRLLYPSSGSCRSSRSSI